MDHDDEDRSAILSRRAVLLSTVLGGIGLAATGSAASNPVCPPRAAQLGARDASAQTDATREDVSTDAPHDAVIADGFEHVEWELHVRAATPRPCLQPLPPPQPCLSRVRPGGCGCE